MLKVLIKKQMTEVFRSCFYNAKKKQMRSKGEIIVMFSVLVVLMVGVLGVMFTFLAVGLCRGLAKTGNDWLYFVVMSGIAIALGTIGGVFSTYSGMYLPKDNDLLLSMPIPVRLIIISRLVNVYLLSVMYSGVVLLPSLIVWWVIAGVTVQNVICGVILFLIVTLIVLMLSCILGWLVAKISLRLKNKSFITVLISLALIGGYYFIYFKAQVWIRELIAGAGIYGTNIKHSAYGLYLFGMIGTGDWFAAGIYAAATGLLLALVLFILSRGFLKLATTTAAVKKVSYREKKVKARSAFGALLSKEFARFTTSPNYMLNCGFGVILIPAFGVFLLIKGPELLTVLGQALPGVPECGGFLICAVLMLLSTMNDMAAPSISLEGRSVWIPQTLPVEAKTVLKAKTSVQLILTELPLLIAVICGAFIVKTSVFDTILIFFLPMLFALFMALFNTFLGVRNPITEWTNEIVPIKQSSPVIIALFGGWGFVALFAVPYFFIGAYLGLTLYLSVWAVILAVVSALLYRWLITKGAEAFSGIS